ncbi:MAG: hypothetical protein GEU82_02240 [Luteitalea sp.]|nr:hypothetical protein [Luteitalea sp.]
METLGHVDGFIVDSQRSRPYYVVVDSGGWFKSKHYLLPVGHARMDGDNDALVVDLPKDRINRFPGFDRSAFEKMSEKELRRFNDDTCQACSTTVISTSAESYSVTDPFEGQWNRPHYAEPTWWNAAAYMPGRMGGAAFAAGVEYPPSKVAPAVGKSTEGRGYQAEQVRATGDRDRDQTARTENDPSPFFDGRAQPGDVIGLDTGGERTHVGETAEDENKRRRDAEEAAKKTRR